MLIYFCLRMLEKPRNNPPSRNAFRIDYEHYVKLFEHLQAEGYIDKYTEIPDGGGHINITLTHVTTAGQEFINDHDYLEELYLSLINGY